MRALTPTAIPDSLRLPPVLSAGLAAGQVAVPSSVAGVPVASRAGVADAACVVAAAAEDGAGAAPRFACIILDLPAAALGVSSTAAHAALLAACRLITPRVEALPPRAALLDLGPGAITAAEAERAVALIRARLRVCNGQHTHVSAGIGPSLTLAQLAAHNAIQRRTPSAVLSAEDAPAFLATLPVSALLHLHLHPQDALSALTADTVQRLMRYGLRTCGQLARLGEPALRAHFGETTGRLLFAAATGHDLRPLCPTPPARRLHVRLRLAAPLAPERLRDGLAPFAARAAAHLHALGLQAGMLRLRVGWEHGGEQRVAHVLREPTADADLLARSLARLLALLPRAPSDADTEDADAEDADDLISDLRLTLDRLAPARPAQPALWRHLRGRHFETIATIAAAADTLAQRHGRPVLYSCAPRLALPDAIFPEDRSTLAPVATAVGSAVGSAVSPSVSGVRPPREALALPAPAPLHADADADADAWAQVPQRLHWW